MSDIETDYGHGYRGEKEERKTDRSNDLLSPFSFSVEYRGYGDYRIKKKVPELVSGLEIRATTEKAVKEEFNHWLGLLKKR